MCIQPSVVETHLVASENAGNGFLARMLPIYPKQTITRSGVTDCPAQGKWNNAVQCLANVEPIDQGSSLVRRTIQLTPDALERFNTHEIEWAAASKTPHALIGEYMGKTGGYCLRIAAALEFMQWAYSNAKSAPPVSIAGETIERAAGLLNDYFIPMAERTYAVSSRWTEDRYADQIVEGFLFPNWNKLFAGGANGQFTASQVRQALRGRAMFKDKAGAKIREGLSHKLHIWRLPREETASVAL